MKKIEFKVAGKVYPCDIPQNWDELSEEQFIIFAGSADKNLVDADLVRRILFLDDAVSVGLMPADWWMLIKELEWLEHIEGYKTGKMDSVTLPDGTECLGFSDDFSDVTWEEWMLADGNATSERWDVVAAILYRPKKKDWDHKSDPKCEFSMWDSDSRLPQFQQLGKDVLAAVALNYKLMRHQLTRRYRRLFSGTDAKGGNSDLQTLIRTVMGDNFFEEDKYLKLAVPSVLFQLDRMVREERERKRNARAN